MQHNHIIVGICRPLSQKPSKYPTDVCVEREMEREEREKEKETLARVFAAPSSLLTSG